MKTVIIDGVAYSEKAEMAYHEGMKFCIIRCCNAGVHAGWLKKYDGQEVHLIDARRLWRWYGKTLSGLATEGSFAPEKCKYSNVVPEIILLDAIEIIPCTQAGRKSIQIVKDWENDK